MNAQEFEKHEKSVLTYLEMLLEKKGMQDLPAEIFADMLVELYLRFEQLLFLSILQELDDDKFEMFQNFMQSEHSREESLKFLTQNSDNLDEIIRRTMREFESVYLSAEGP